MGVTNLWSKRKRGAERASETDVYQYEILPAELLVQIIHIWTDAIGPFVMPGQFARNQRPVSNAIWTKIHKTLCRELGRFDLSDRNENAFAQCNKYLQSASTDHALDLIELTFSHIERYVSRIGEYDRRDARMNQSPADALEELNARFREHGVGYQYSDGHIIRVDSVYVHAEVVKPALALLHREGFAGPLDEFLRAHEHHRHGRHKEAIAEACKALESTLKAICEARKWNPPPNATAKPLLDFVFKNGLIPKELESHFTGLRTAMESGLSTLGNRTSRHGQGATITEIPPYMAAYALHLAASNIVFLVEAHLALDG